MTHEEKESVVQQFCSGKACYDCAIDDLCTSVSGDFLSNKRVCNEAYRKITSIRKAAPDPNANVEMVNHPTHYNREGSIECIDEMELIFGKEAVKHFCLCNAWKYRYRSSAKNGEEDIKKSDWYIQKYKELTVNE